VPSRRCPTEPAHVVWDCLNIHLDGKDALFLLGSLDATVLLAAFLMEGDMNTMSHRPQSYTLCGPLLQKTTCLHATYGPVCRLAGCGLRRYRFGHKSRATSRLPSLRSPGWRYPMSCNDALLVTARGQKTSRQHKTCALVLPRQVRKFCSR